MSKKYYIILLIFTLGFTILLSIIGLLIVFYEKTYSNFYNNLQKFFCIYLVLYGFYFSITIFYISNKTYSYIKENRPLSLNGSFWLTKDDLKEHYNMHIQALNSNSLNNLELEYVKKNNDNYVFNQNLQNNVESISLNLKYSSQLLSQNNLSDLNDSNISKCYSNSNLSKIQLTSSIIIQFKLFIII